jgi:hypothetical protein
MTEKEKEILICLNLNEEEKEMFKSLIDKYQKKEFIENIIKSNPDRTFTPDDKFVGFKGEFIILEEDK